MQPSQADFHKIKKIIESFCAYQERCTQEVMFKMSGFSLTREEQEQMMQHLVFNRFVNDQRYCESIVSGKFRIKQWGKLKIKGYLIQKNIPTTIIQNAINGIDDKEYCKTIEKLVLKKMEELKNEKDIWKKKSKIFRFVHGKGFEFDMCQQYINALITD